jgi:peroxiredoxin Q/BCP
MPVHHRQDAPDHEEYGRSMLTDGDIAPDFDLADHKGGRIRMQDLRGRWVVLWWYPKASTPG